MSRRLSDRTDLRIKPSNEQMRLQLHLETVSVNNILILL